MVRGLLSKIITNALKFESTKFSCKMMVLNRLQ